MDETLEEAIQIHPPLLLLSWLRGAIRAVGGQMKYPAAPKVGTRTWNEKLPIAWRQWYACDKHFLTQGVKQMPTPKGLCKCEPGVFASEDCGCLREGGLTNWRCETSYVLQMCSICINCPPLVLIAFAWNELTLQFILSYLKLCLYVYECQSRGTGLFFSLNPHRQVVFLKTAKEKLLWCTRSKLMLQCEVETGL